MKRLIEHIEVEGVMRVVTGLRIGAGGSSIEIGGLDNPILRDPVTRIPYVPGSSVKGKLRSLIEVNKYRIGEFLEPRATTGPCGCGGCVACWLFGCGDVKNASEPTRLIFRDCKMHEESIGRLEPLLAEGIFYSEVKAEVTMDRTSGKVGGAGPRSMDRIAADTKLTFRITCRVLEGDRVAEMKAALAHALTLLEAEGLGGSVTRGYGEVQFEELTWAGAAWEFRAKAVAA